MKRFTYEFVKEQFEKEGCRLITKNYRGQHQKLSYKCSEGHECVITYSDFRSGRRCSICSEKRRVAKRRLDISDITDSFNKEGWTLFPVKYKNCDQKLNCICSKGHKHSISWHNWNNGWRCPFCHYERMSIIHSGKNHWNWKGGISCEPYCDAWADKEYKKSILERDNYQCQNPDCWGTSKRLTIHHIDYVKKHCDPWNLITLCDSCNSRANFNREWYKDFYRTIVKKKYNFKEV